MEEYFCSSCNRPLSLKDMESESFKHIAGKLFCATCLSRMQQMSPMKCKKCGSFDTPLYDGKAYLCRRCGSEIAKKTDSEAVRDLTRTEMPPALRPDTKECPYCGGQIRRESIRCRFCGSSLTREQHDLGAAMQQHRHIGIWLGSLGALCVVLFIFSLFVLFKVFLSPEAARRGVEPAYRAMAPELQSKLDDLRERLDDHEQDKKQTASSLASLAVSMSKTNGALESLASRMGEASRNLGTLAVKTEETNRSVGSLDTKMSGATKSVDSLGARIGELERTKGADGKLLGQYKQRLEAIEGDASAVAAKLRADRTKQDRVAEELAASQARLERIERAVTDLARAVEQAARAAKPTVAPKPEAAPEVTTTVPTIPKKEVDVPSPPPAETEQERLKKKIDREAEQAYNSTKAAAAALLQGELFAQALEFYDSFPATYKYTRWQKLVDQEREAVRTMAVAKWESDKAAADALIRQRKFKEARVFYDRAAKYGLPEITEELEPRLQDLEAKQLADAITKAPEPAVEETSPELSEWIAKLSHSNDRTRNEAAKKLGDLGDRAAVPHLVDMLDDADWLVRATAIKSLGKLRDRSAIPALIEKLKDPFSFVPLTASRELERLTGQRDLGEDYAKWSGWYEQHKGELAAPPPKPGPSPEKPDPSFKTTVILVNEKTNSIVLAVPEGVTLRKGDALAVYKGADLACTMIVKDTIAGVAMGDLDAISSKVELKDDDEVVVRPARK